MRFGAPERPCLPRSLGMAERPNCPICAKRRTERFCPAKGERICAICCGTEREVTLDCPTDCTYLISAHRYQREHHNPLSESEIPFRETQFSPDLLYDQQPLLSGLSYTIVKFSRERRDLVDRDVLTSLTALAETYRTLTSGIYYQKPPSARLANVLYAALDDFIQDYRKQETERTESPTLKDTDIFHSLVFLARVCRTRTNERPRARIFLEFLRAQFPAAEGQPETSRIITP